ncbi:MAG: TIR domain-containing protein [Gallionella sp.]
MSSLTTKSLFISHAWTQNLLPWKQVVGWFEDESDFPWRNCSCPDSSLLEDKSSQSLAAEITRQIASAQAVIILSEMYAANSAWVDYEISEAKRMNKLIIGVAPLVHGCIPGKIKNAADLMSAGYSSSLISMVRFIA